MPPEAKRRNGPGDGRAFRFGVLAGLVCLAAAVLVLTGVLAGGALRTSAQGEQRSAPAALLTRLERMDDDLRRLIGDFRRGSIGPDSAEEYEKFIRRARQIELQKLDLVRDYFDGPTYGSIKRSMVFKQFDCVDQELTLALALGTNDRNRNGVLETLARAKTCKRILERELRTAAGVPPPVLTRLERMDDDLRRLIGDFRRGSIGPDSAEEYEKFIKRARQIELQKLDLVRDYFDGPTYGSVKWSMVFKQFDCVDQELTLALALGTNDRNRNGVLETLQRAKRCKQSLERDLRQTQDLALRITSIKANFVEADRATYYTVPTVTNPSGGAIAYRWTLSLQAVDPTKDVDNGCVNARGGGFSGTASQFIWAHGNIGDPVHDDGCDHSLQGQYGHQGLIAIRVSDSRGQSCTATYKGTNTSGANSVQNGVASNPSCSGPNP
jgi:BMFP domain-containing protein YqiC